MNPMLYTPSWVASPPPQTPVCGAPGCQVYRVNTRVHSHMSPMTRRGLGGHNMPVRVFLNTIFAPKLVRGMDGLVVCAMAGARRGWGFEPRFVRPSRGPSVRPPPPPPSASRSTTGTAGATGGVSPAFFPTHPPPGGQTHTHTKNEAPGTAHLQQRASSLLPPSAGWRMSSSYSSSACPRKRTRTGVFRAAVSCATAPPCCAKPDESLVPLSQHPPCLPLHECFPCMSEITHTKNEAPSTAHLQQRAPSLLPASAGWRVPSS